MQHAVAKLPADWQQSFYNAMASGDQTRIDGALQRLGEISNGPVPGATVAPGTFAPGSLGGSQPWTGTGY